FGDVEMTRPCTICGHPRRDEIDASLLNNARYEAIATRFRTSLMSILAHRSHVDGPGAPPAGLTPGEQNPSMRLASVATLLDETRPLLDRSLALLQTAEASNDPRRLSLTLVQLRRNLRALGDLGERVRQSVRATTAADVPPPLTPPDGVACS